jgi:hypothetical protein
MIPQQRHILVFDIGGSAALVIPVMKMSFVACA